MVFGNFLLELLDCVDRYLLQVMLEANCLEWSIIVAILLHDAMAVFRVTNAARSPDHSLSAVQRLRDGILSLLQWTNTQW